MDLDGDVITKVMMMMFHFGNFRNCEYYGSSREVASTYFKSYGYSES